MKKCYNLSSLCISLVIALCGAFAVHLISKYADETEHQKVYYNTGVITELGQCYNDRCAFKYKDAFGSEKIGESSSPVIKGQLVYQECWYEIKNGNQCYVDYSPSKD